MSKGKARTKLLAHSAGLADGNKGGSSWSFIYEASTVKHPDYDIGDRVVLPDGREFRFAKSSAACHTNKACEFTATGYVSYTAFATNHAIGDVEVTVPAATHAALVEDELRGGYVIIFDGAGTSYIQFRGIVGNDEAVANAAFKIYLDGPLTDTVASGTEAIEVYQNPFAALKDGGTTTLPIAGLPATEVSAADMYFWVQVKGLCWSSPQAGVGGTNGQFGAFWRHDGSVEKADTALATTVPANSSSQYAGYCVEGTAAGNGPLFMLQG